MIVIARIVNHILVGIIQPITTYFAMWTEDFVIPTRPAPYDVTIDNNATFVVRNRMEAAHQTLNADYKVIEQPKKGASQFIRAVVGKMWYKALRHPITFYNNVTAFALLEYLRTNSSGLHSHDLAKLPSKMLHY